MNTEIVSIDDIHADPANTRRHPERNQATIRASLTRFGPGRSLVLDGRNVVRAGNGTLEQARLSGFDEVLIVDPKPNQIVAVRRLDWSDTEATGYSIADNTSSDQAENDDIRLAEQLQVLPDDVLLATGWDEGERQALIERLGTETLLSVNHDLEGSNGFASGNQFNDTGGYVVEIKLSRQQNDDEVIKTKIANVCEEFNLDYRIVGK